MARNRCDGLLARVDFPLYTLQTLTNRHVIVAGGGGASNTGVANGFEIFELSHNGSRFVAEEVMRHETGPNVVMNCSVRNIQNRTYLTAGQESHCQLYKVNIRMVDAAEMRRGSFRAENGLVRRRRRTVSENDNISKKDSNSNTTEKRISFEIRPSDSVQTDFGDDPLQRVVRISHDGKLMATGGIDGKVRVWSFPKMELLFVLEGHTKELDDLDFSPCGTKLVSIAKDGLANVWSTARKQKPLLQLTCQPPNGNKYLFRRCRFGAIEDKPGSWRMFTIANPLSRSGRATGVLQQWGEGAGGGPAAAVGARGRVSVGAGGARRRSLRRRRDHVQRLRGRLRRLQFAAGAAREERAHDVRDGAGVPAGARLRATHHEPQRGRAALHLGRQLRLRAQPAAQEYNTCLGGHRPDHLRAVLHIHAVLVPGYITPCTYGVYYVVAVYKKLFPTTCGRGVLRLD